ncbi:uncharacterized protein PGTG_04620 [Puccinia graminis f. sp. tritici CRL 75-36-700-3]|uniref:Uncharacterized protein n=1 Tax=Puccinia graminis f. sp. tritici (strain CRL 75-36-700-3 / race SCCL) TaxID=418459 RepID=E3K2U5_PUCGT|nr:uncharacterized protein PGTG_04620 [Puccinia graminis f. sp. tritici CRL 75-36-700-3]EFP78664.2 hypothetical protein PGTG_04620 [Puccinia graminis f. sp. tritici CRL 75-36-700-3]
MSESSETSFERLQSPARAPRSPASEAPRSPPSDQLDPPSPESIEVMNNHPDDSGTDDDQAQELGGEERLTLVEERVTSVIGFEHGRSIENLPTMARVMRQMQIGQERMRDEISELLDRRVTDLNSRREHMDILNRVMARLLDLEYSVRARENEGSTRERSGTRVPNRAREPESPAHLLDGLLEVLRRQFGAVLVTARLQGHSTEERESIINECQARITAIRTQELVMTNEIISGFGGRVLLEENEFRAEIVRNLNERADFRAIMEDLNRVYEMVRLMKAAGILTEDGNPVRPSRNRARFVSESTDGAEDSISRDQMNVAGILGALRFLRSPRVRPNGRERENHLNDVSMASPSPLPSASSILRNACRVNSPVFERERPVASSSKRPADEERSRAGFKRARSSP